MKCTCYDGKCSICCAARTTSLTDNLDFEIPSISYLKKGDRIRLVSKKRREVLYATTTMDGHAVSEHYGLHQGNTYYSDNPDKNYINVKFDHIKTYTLIGHANDGIYEKDGWRIFVTRDVSRRVFADIDREKASREDAEKAEKRRVLEAQLAAVQANLTRIQTQLEELKPVNTGWHIDPIKGSSFEVHLVAPDGTRLYYGGRQCAERDMAKYISGEMKL